MNNIINVNIKELYNLFMLEKKNILKNRNNLIILEKEFNNLDLKNKNIINKIIKAYIPIINIYKLDEAILFLNKNNIKYDIFNKSNNIVDYLTDKKYTFIKFINSGMYGSVYLYKKNNKLFACKIEKWNEGEEEINDFIKRKNNEYELSKKIGINHIGPKIYNNDYILTYDNLYNILIMEYIEGDTLHNFLINKKYTKDDINNIKSIIDDKLRKLHKLNIFHRDLHLNNIMIFKKNKKFNIYIIDMGRSMQRNNVLNNISNRNLKVINYIDNFNKSRINIHTNLQNIIIYNLYKNKKINFIF